MNRIFQKNFNQAGLIIASNDLETIYYELYDLEFFRNGFTTPIKGFYPKYIFMCNSFRDIKELCLLIKEEVKKKGMFSRKHIKSLISGFRNIKEYRETVKKELYK